jgi:hypothetical protein
MEREYSTVPVGDDALHWPGLAQSHRDSEVRAPHAEATTEDAPLRCHTDPEKQVTISQTHQGTSKKHTARDGTRNLGKGKGGQKRGTEKGDRYNSAAQLYLSPFSCNSCTSSAVRSAVPHEYCKVRDGFARPQVHQVLEIRRQVSIHGLDQSLCFRARLHHSLSGAIVESTSRSCAAPARNGRVV